MYFCLSGKIGVGYTLIYQGKNYKISKYFSNNFIIFDHYILNNKRSEFLYIVFEPIKCFGISKKFLKNKIYPTF